MYYSCYFNESLICTLFNESLIYIFSKTVLLILVPALIDFIKDSARPRSQEYWFALVFGAINLTIIAIIGIFYFVRWLVTN